MPVEFEEYYSRDKERTRDVDLGSHVLKSNW